MSIFKRSPSSYAVSHRNNDPGSLRHESSHRSKKWLDENLVTQQCFQELLSSSEDEDDSHDALVSSNPHQNRLKSFQLSFSAGKDIQRIALTKNRAWASCWFNNEVKLCNHNGEERKVLSLDTIITDISFSTATNELWVCCRDKTVRERETLDTTRIAFKTQLLPLSICMTNDGAVLIGMEFKIMKYDLDGKILKTITSTELKHNLIYPQQIRQCRTTGRVAILDSSYTAWGGNGTPTCLVYDKSFALQFSYSGVSPLSQRKFANVSDDVLDEDIDEYVNISNSPVTLVPRDICFGPDGRILVADYMHGVVFSLTDTGKFSQELYSSTEFRPCTLDCTKKGNLWIGCKRKIVHILTV